jgi:serine/threonine protein kinase
VNGGPNVMPDAVRSHEVVTDDAHIGRYRILRRLEVNAISEMVLAVTEGALGFERTVIIKRLLPHAHADPKRARSFGYEASAYARLTHPAIVRLFDFITVNEMPAMVLEHVDGVPLQALLETLRARGEKLPMAAALYIGARVFAALSAAHAARDSTTHEASPVIHRDVSPGNVLIAGNGDVKLSNFGFAKLAGSATTEMSMETPKGTVGYMAPEQLMGDPITMRTDVYVGALLVRELLIGAPVFMHGEEPYVNYLESMAKPSLAPMRGVCPELPHAVADALENALEPKSERRRVSALEMQRILNAHRAEGRAALKAILTRLELARDDGDQSDDSSITVPSMARLEARARRARVAALVFASFALVLGGIVARSGLSSGRALLARVPMPSPQIAVARAATPVTTASPAPHTPPPEPAPPPSPSLTTPTTGELRAPPSTPSHRIFVDGRFVGESGGAFVVACGQHRVRVGGGGRPQGVVVPCGGSLTLGGAARER